MNIDRWVWEHIQETFQEVRTVNLETSFPSLSESAKERLLYLPRRDQTRKNPHELARKSEHKKRIPRVRVLKQTFLVSHP
ncbi:hypothetical protein LEP1GSC068_0978 [Leptospira sp. Fiocruz LV3954]|nr:hypothetical protein LEP1GSC068_0978 [Leptospira sp. Fiocruz LV3954]